MASARLLRDQEVGDDRDYGQHGQRECRLGDDVVDGQRPDDARLLIRVRLGRVRVGVYRLSTVAGGSGTELRVSTLRLRQGLEYRVAALAHRRILS